MTEITGSHGVAEERRSATESGARRRAGAAGPARNEEAPRKRKDPSSIRLCVFAALLRFVTRYAGLLRVAACGLRSRLRCSVSLCDAVVSAPSGRLTS